MSVTVTPVRFEHHRTALGIGESRPRLSWITTTAPSGWSQAGYEIEQRDGDSIRVDSTESVLVPWPFASLESRERREVRVRVIGSDGVASDWSEWAFVETGLLEPSEWSAAMVGPVDPQIAAPLVRGAFDVGPAPVRRARVYATGHGVFRLELNGMRVGDDELAPGWTAYPSRLRYSTYDVTDQINAGGNVIGAWVGDGWWRGYLGWGGKKELYGSDLGVLVQLEIEYADGTRQTVASGAGWTCGPGPIRSADLYNGEDYDARALDATWSSTRFDASAWSPVAIRTLDGVELVAPDGPPVRVVETRAVQHVLTSPSGKTILDFGQNLVGRLRLTVRGDAGTVITLRHAEVLEHGELATEPLRGAKATDTYTLAGSGEESWAPRFTFHGFRYAEVSGWPGEFDPGAVVAEVLHSDMERTGWFTTDNELVDRLHENVLWGMKGNFVDVPTDCPQRDERLGWTGDLQVFAPTATYLYDSAGFLVSWLKDLAAEQKAYGGTPMVVPAVVTGYTGPTAGWADAATIVPWVLYQTYGDLGVLAEQFDSMVAWVEEVCAAAGEDRVWSAGFQFGDWLDPMAPANRPEQAQTYPEIVATAYFARSSRILADAAELLGRRDEAQKYGRLADEVREAFVREYVSASGRLLSDSATAYSLALVFDLISGTAERQHAADRLAEIIVGGGYKIATGFIGTPIITDALSANGHADVAYRLLLQTEAPSWLYAVEQGATTIWERWDSLLPDGTVNPSGMTSFNHYAFGAVADWMHRVVAGLAPAAPGYRRILISPQPPRRGLRSASATLRTPYGTAAAGWRYADGTIRVSATVPVGVIADVVLPSGKSLQVSAGEHEWTEPFEVDIETEQIFTVDSRMGDIVDNKPALAVLTGVIGKWVPGAAEHMSGNMRGQEDTTPRQITAYFPDPAGVLADLERGFAAIAAGEDIPADVLTASAPAAVDDPALREKAVLLSGSGYWSTHASDGVASITITDGPHGVRLQKGESDNLGIHDSLPATCFPTEGAMGSTWDRELLYAVGEAIGTEARALDVNVILGPAVNVKRSPLGGRAFEYLAEDPVLAGVLATEYVRGVQSTGVGTSVKHFAVNSQETNRMRVSADVDARALRELYLPAFERVVREAAPTSIMSAYNALNGVFASENRWLLTDLLRDEWGFDGLVVSDWGAIKDRVEALRAGLDLEMPGTGDEGTDAILTAVREGRLDRTIVERAAGRMATLVARTRLDDDRAFDPDAHHALARRAAGAAIVLLRNERQTLPLRSGLKVAVVGTFAVEPPFQGGGSSHVNPTRVDVPLEELRAALGSANVGYAPGYTTDGDSEALRAEAQALVADADVAVVFAGLYEKEQSEGFDRTTIDLPADHVALIQAVAARAPRTVVVLCNGGVVSLEPWHDSVDAIVEGWALGQGVGGALADVLSGAVNPSGRLAESIPYRLEDTPSFLSFPGENGVVRYDESVFVGYRYYTTTGRPVRYPFGHGLSYSTFSHDTLEVSVAGRDTVRVRVTVRNSGDVAGAEVVQVYVAPPPSPVRRPVRGLAGFEKVHLEPGQSRTVEVVLDRRAFAYWDVVTDGWRVQPGSYAIEIGRSSAEIGASTQVTLEGDSIAAQPLSLDSTVGEWFGHPVVGPALTEAMMAGAPEEQRSGANDDEAMLKMVESMPMGQFVRFPGVDISEDELAHLISLSMAEIPKAGS